jgi:hypothetical protein
MSTSTSLSRPAADALAAELNRLGVLFLRSHGSTGSSRSLSPASLLAGLAVSDDARLRLALIPLLLARPDYSDALPEALNGLSIEAQVLLRCYATAAVLLQRQYTRRLFALYGLQAPIRDWFSTELAIPQAGTTVERLAALAERQRQLSGRSINWLGTYQHAAQGFLQFAEQRQRWTA